MIHVQIPEDELGPSISVGQELSDAVSQVGEGVVAPRGPQDDHGEDELQQQAPDHRAPRHLNIGRESFAQTDHGKMSATKR